MKIYAFDVDHTLEVSQGPITWASVKQLVEEGHIVGLNGNWAVVTNRVWGWWLHVSFLGPMGATKEQFLRELQTYIPAEEYIMVGNDHVDPKWGTGFVSMDGQAARDAGWRFICEDDFASGKR
jgi:hypothetical protein